MYNHSISAISNFHYPLIPHFLQVFSQKVGQSLFPNRPFSLILQHFLEIAKFTLRLTDFLFSFLPINFLHYFLNYFHYIQGQHFLLLSILHRYDKFHCTSVLLHEIFLIFEIHRFHLYYIVSIFPLQKTFLIAFFRKLSPDSIHILAFPQYELPTQGPPYH